MNEKQFFRNWVALTPHPWTFHALNMVHTSFHFDSLPGYHIYVSKPSKNSVMGRIAIFFLNLRPLDPPKLLFLGSKLFYDHKLV